MSELKHRSFSFPVSLRHGALAALAAAALFAPAGHAQLLTLSDLPLYVGANVQPLVMISLSKDQQLFKKAYNDYSDLDADGDLETTYKHSINYYGYFDPYKCYNYSSANKRFEPQFDTRSLAAADQKYCDTVAGDWSGNFLNWSTMSRMDAVRKLLYGGLRSPNRTTGDGNGLVDGDTATDTVLERAYLPPDAHSWAKYYNGGDITRLTPVTPDNVTNTSISSVAIAAANNITFNLATAFAAADYSIGDVVEFARTSFEGTHYIRGVVDTVTAPTSIRVDISAANILGTGTFASWQVRNLSRQGITICNTTLGGAAPQDKSQTNTNLPRIRVAKRNYSLWSANERRQCYWSGEEARSNSNNFQQSSIPAFSSNPDIAVVGTGTGLGDLFARVQVCVAGLIGTEKCKQYPTTGSVKPIGLLQVYGDSSLLQFGLMTGSYRKNVSGGVLRKNIGAMSDEINLTTDGTFKTASLVAAYPGIVNSLNRMRIYGYNYVDGTYLAAAGDQCGFQLTSITENTCTSWGNPMSEVYYESLRYLAGGKPLVSSVPQPTAAYTFTYAGSKDETLGLPLPAWTDPLTQNTYCAPLNTIVFNASVSTNDNDQIPAGSTKSYLGSGNLATGFTAAMGAKTPTQWTDDIGAATGENIHGGNYFVGRSGTSTDELCTAKTVTSLGSISGICPEGPTLSGSYLISGLAYAAHINRIRSDLTVPASNTSALKVNTYAVQLATNVPQLNIQLSGETTPRVVIQPTYRMFQTAPQGGGALVDLRVISTSRGTNFHTGRVYLNWEDSEQGGDYDQDIWGLLSWCMQTGTNTTSCPGQGANTISVRTQTIAESTGNPQGFGYIVSGTTKDGPHFHSGIEVFNYTDPTNIAVTGGSVNASGGCLNCGVGNSASTATYALGTSVGTALKDPLLYAAKWGGFNEQGTGGNNRPDLVIEWDQKDSAGNAVPDGIPDNYFLVSNPLGLESALDKAFVAILTTSSASSVATNSTSLNNGSRVFQARFNSNDWSGQLLSFTIDLNGVVASVPEWDAGQKINAQLPDTRNIATMDDSVIPRLGKPFRWANLNAAQQTFLNTSISNVNDGVGASRLLYLRGDASNEGLGATNFRRRVSSKLGDIVNSNPQFVGPPNSSGTAYSATSYATFKTTYAGRPEMIYAGANDGMLHAFDASTNPATQGTEVFAYVPSNVYYKLPWLTAQSYAHRYFVDGTPIVADICTGSPCDNWRTVLAGTQAAGGQSVFLLDVTDPSANTEAATLVPATNWALWEFKDSDHGGRIGNIFGFPRIAKMNNGKWAVIVSSGYNHSYRCTALPCTGGDHVDIDDYPQGRANLYIIFIEDGITKQGDWVEGVDFIRINTNTGSGGTPNGLTSPTLLDTDGDGDIDYIYAGDLRGNLWKFDVSNPNPGSCPGSCNWRLAFSGTPLYRARDPSGAAQVITAPPEVMNHPNGGYLVVFGTGRYLQPSDPNPTYSVNTIYGVWDKPSAGAITSSVTTRDSALLQQQTFIAAVTVGGINFTVVSDNPVDYSTQRGWYLDFLNSDTTGERMVVNPILSSFKVVITSLVPSTTSCDAGGKGLITDLNPLTGGRLLESPFDLNGDGLFTSADLVTVVINGVSTQVAVSGRESQVGITATPTIISGGPGKEFKVTSGSTGGRESILENPGGTAAAGATRRSWREILQN